MVDGANCPGYPEPEPKEESTSKLRLAGIALLRGMFYLLSLLVPSAKMVLSGTVGALLAINFDQTLPEGISSDTFQIVILFFVFLFVIYHHLKKSVENTNSSSWK